MLQAFFTGLKSSNSFSASLSLCNFCIYYKSSDVFFSTARIVQRLSRLFQYILQSMHRLNRDQASSYNFKTNYAIIGIFSCMNGKSSLRFIFGSNGAEMFYKNCVFKRLAKSSEKHLCQNLFFNRVAVCRSVTLLKKENPVQVFFL